MGENILFSEALFVISSVPERNYLFKVSYSSTRIWCENCWGLNMKTKRHFSVFIKRLLGSNWKDKHFWRVYHGLCCSILKFINKLHLNLYLHNPTGESVRNFCEGVYFRLSFWLKYCGPYSKWPAVHLSFL